MVTPPDYVIFFHSHFFLNFFSGQILVNLLSNSVKFSSNGDIIVTVTLRYLESRTIGDFAVVEFSVTDHGIGIPEDVQRRIFQPFFQADSSVNRKYGGSGLGLNISKRLAELMGGKI
jgi:signal transduction histidine kinase